MNALRTSLRAAVFAAPAATLFAALVTTATARAQSITPAPAFNAERLSTLPRDERITNGGTIANQRYSPLDLINRGNVAGLKGLWRTGLESGTGPGNSAQAQVLVFEGVIYVSTGDNDVFALDVDTGEILWSTARIPIGAPAIRSGARTAASRSAKAECSSAGSTRSSSRSISARERCCGRKSSRRGKRATASRAPRSITTAWSLRASAVA